MSKPNAVESVAQSIVRQIRVLLKEDGGDQENPATWIRIARRAGCRVYGFTAPGGRRGEYAPVDENSGLGVICFNLACTPARQARILAHELAHHFEYHSQPTLFPAFTGAFYGGNAKEFREAVARRVERLLFA